MYKRQAKVHVCTEKTMAYHPEYHGIRLDVYADDANHTRFNIETVSYTHLQCEIE